MYVLQSEDLINQGGLSALSRQQSVRTHLPMQETQVPSLGGEDPLEEEMATLPGKSHGQRNLVGYSPRGCKGSDTTERTHMRVHTHTVLLIVAHVFPSFKYRFMGESSAWGKGGL